MEDIAVLNDYPEYSLHDNVTVNLSFQSISMHVFHAAVSIKCCSVTFWILLTPRLKMFFSVFSSVPFICVL